MKAKKLLLILMIILISGNSVRSQIKIDHNHFTSLYNKRLFNQLFNEASYIRIYEEFGKNWMIDYYMAISLCGMGKRNLANDAFSYIKNEYPLHPQQKKFIDDSRLVCGPPSHGESAGTKIKMAYLVLNNSNSTSYPVSLVTGKLGQVLNCDAKLEEYQFNPSFDNVELQNRLFKFENKEAALAYYTKFLPAKIYNINHYGRYIVVTKKPENLNSIEVEKAAKEMERVYQFYVDKYSIRPPDKLITVYLMGNLANLREVAQFTHGLKIPVKSYGYSCIDDLSVLGNSTKTGLGTIKHELFHLIVRSDIGDIPGWLDEGVASLYEESHWEGELLKYDKNLWRTEVLRKNSTAGKPLPLIRTLINNNWNEFTPSDNTTLCELSVNYALAKHFTMFLEDLGRLQQVVGAYRDRKCVFTDTTEIALNRIQILELALDQELTEIQKDFDTWLLKKYKILSNRDKKSLLERMAHLDEIIEVVCPVRPDKAGFLEECVKLRQELSNSGPELSDDLFERCLKLLALGEKMYSECEMQ